MATDWNAAFGIPKKKDGSTDWNAAFGVGTGTAPQQFAGQIDQAAYQSALQKKKTGQPLTPLEQRAFTAMQASLKTITNVGVALQPFLAISDVVKGIASDVKADITTGKPGTNTTGGNRGIAAAVGHVTYGLSEYLPGLTGSRAKGVTGAELLVGTPYEGNPKAALAVELLSDPSVVFTGAGLAAKAPATLAKLADLEALAKTAGGAALIRGALNSANTAGTKLLRLGDEATGLPAVGRGLTNAGVTGKVTGAASRLADVTLPDSRLKRFFLGDARTVGDTFYTPDVRRAVYTDQQLANQTFRDGRTIEQGDLGHTLSTAVVQDAQYLKTLTKGLKPADAQETIRLLGAFTNATDPAIAAEALRKLTVISTRTGKDLEQPFVAAVKAANRVDQTTLGARLEAVGGPAILDPAVTKAIQEAQSGADLVAQAGKYVDDTGRPRGILAAQYTGRGNPDAVIEGIKKVEAKTGPTPASVTLDPPVITRTVDDAAKNLDVPASPMMPTGTTAKTTALPVNTAEVASEVTGRTTDQVLADLFGSKDATVSDAAKLPDPVNVAPKTTDKVLADLFSNEPVPVRAAPEPTPPASVVDAAAAPPSPVNSAADLRAGLGDMGSGVSDSLHDMLHTRYLAGETTELGQPSNVLIGAQQLKAKGVDLTREQWPDFASQFSRKLTETSGAPDRTAQLRSFLDEYAPPAPKTSPAPVTPNQALADLFNPEAAAGKTPTNVVREVTTPAATDPYVQAGDFSKTAQADSKTVGIAAPPVERLVTKTVPTTYRTVQVDSSAIDWAALPDAAARREVSNTIGNGFGLRQDVQGRYVPNKAAVTLPLDHPVVSRYFDNDAIEGARFGGDSGYGELVQQTRQQVPNWYNPKDPAPMAVQRATRDAESLAREALTYPNVYNQKLLNLEGMNKLDDWLGGEALAFAQKAGKPPATPLAIDYAANEYAARVAALRGSPPTRAEVFRYRMQLARVQRAQRLRDLTGSEVTTHLQDFFKANPEATLYEATLSAAKQFGIGSQGAKYMQRILRSEESGFLRQMSSLERKEFAQYIKGRDLIRSGQGGGGLGTRLLRNPEAVSLQFKQVFPEEENALKLLTEQAKTRTSYILKAENLRNYHDFLTQSGQHLTESQLFALRKRPLNSLTPEERALRSSISDATDTAGVPAGWKRMDTEAGPFKKGDVVPWWAYHDLFVAGKVDDVAVAGRVLQRGGLDAYSRLWASQNAQMLSGVSSIVNDQVGMFQQMLLWGISPDQILNGMVRRLAAGSNAEGRAMLKTMREQGIASAKLESNLSLEKSALEGLARRLDGDTELSRFQRVADAGIRWREYGTGTDRGALTNPVAKVSADVWHFGGAYLFQARSAMADIQRESLYFHYLSEGMTPGAAAGAANDVLMDMRLAPAYSKAVSKFWPFFRWISMSGPRGIMTVFKRPALSHTYQQIPTYSDILSDGKDDKNDARRILARDGGYVNLGEDARPMSGGTTGPRLYLDSRNWDVENTIPQLLDWGGTKVGPVGLPWYANLVAAVGWGADRNGNGIYSSLLGGRAGGWQQAVQADRKQASIIAAKYVASQFEPSYAPGSSRAIALANSIIETAKLPDDGSRDVAIAKTLMGTEWGQIAVRFLQQGKVGLAANVPLTGNRGSPYSNATPSMAQSGLNFIVPIRSINADQSVQGDAQQQVAIGILEVQNLISQKKKEIAGMMANPATTPDQIRRATDEANALIERKYGAVDRLDGMTR